MFLPVIVVSFCMARLLDLAGRVELMMPVLASVFVLGLLLVLKWRLRRYAWFWITMAVFVGLQHSALLRYPWTKKWVPAATSAGIATLDTFAMLAIISVVGRLRGSEV